MNRGNESDYLNIKIHERCFQNNEKQKKKNLRNLKSIIMFLLIINTWFAITLKENFKFQTKQH